MCKAAHVQASIVCHDDGESLSIIHRLTRILGGWGLIDKALGCEDRGVKGGIGCFYIVE